MFKNIENKLFLKPLSTERFPFYPLHMIGSCLRQSKSKLFSLVHIWMKFGGFVSSIKWTRTIPNFRGRGSDTWGRAWRGGTLAPPITNLMLQPRTAWDHEIGRKGRWSWNVLHVVNLGRHCACVQHTFVLSQTPLGWLSPNLEHWVTSHNKDLPNRKFLFTNTYVQLKLRLDQQQASALGVYDSVP